ncbi:MAG: hypothetical protein Q8S96_19850 [Hydrogenophaga sp.]|uniref:hypothetical protein n=1 Tax=Hydrogenophaga sp. TaxID=1904254 RepID=UPI002733D3A8|nr:hypothetical protein [Hydrogenophaga sp.]MDP3346688.1 hypothetical protein [Hydrogenophaga sp.]MDP3809079.1 hypothetical protein [Hydrogenophaga sp.]
MKSSFFARAITLASIFLSSIIISRNLGSADLLDFIYYSTTLNFISAIALKDWEYRVFSDPSYRSLKNQLIFSSAFSILAYGLIQFTTESDHKSTEFYVVVLIYGVASVLISLFKTKNSTQPLYELLKSGSFGVVGLIVIIFYIYFYKEHEEGLLKVFLSSSIIVLTLSTPALLLINTKACEKHEKTGSWMDWAISIVGISLLTIESILSKHFVNEIYSEYYSVYNRVIFLCYAGYAVYNNHVIREISLNNTENSKTPRKLIVLISIFSVIAIYPVLQMVLINKVPTNHYLAALLILCAWIQVSVTFLSAGDFFRVIKIGAQKNFLKKAISATIIYAIILYIFNLLYSSESILYFISFVIASVFYNISTRWALKQTLKQRIYNDNF